MACSRCCARWAPSQRNRWPPATDASRLLEGVRDFENTEIVATPTHNLDADGQPFRSKAGRHRDGWQRS